MGGTIHNVLVIAEKQAIGACLVAVLLEHGYHATIVESYGRLSDVVQDIKLRKFDLVIATNTSFPPAYIRSIVPDIKSRHPHARILVLSGYCPDDFVADLRQRGMDGFLPLPYDEKALLREVAEHCPRQDPDRRSFL